MTSLHLIRKPRLGLIQTATKTQSTQPKLKKNKTKRGGGGREKSRAIIIALVYCDKRNIRLGCEVKCTVTARKKGASCPGTWGEGGADEELRARGLNSRDLV